MLQRPGVKPNLTVLKTNKNNNRLLDITPSLDQYLALNSSKRLLPAADGNKHRDSESDIMQRVRDLGALSPKLNVSIKSIPSKFRETCSQRGITNAGGRRDEGH